MTCTVNRLNYINFFIGVVNPEKNVVIRLFPFDMTNVRRVSDLTKQKMKKSIKCNILSMKCTYDAVDSYTL